MNTSFPFAGVSLQVERLAVLARRLSVGQPGRRRAFATRADVPGRVLLQAGPRGPGRCPRGRPFRTSTASRNAGTQLLRLSQTSVAVARTFGVMAGHASRMMAGVRSSPNRPSASRVATWTSGGSVALIVSARTAAASLKRENLQVANRRDPRRVRLTRVPGRDGRHPWPGNPIWPLMFGSSFGSSNMARVRPSPRVRTVRSIDRASAASGRDCPGPQGQIADRLNEDRAHVARSARPRPIRKLPRRMPARPACRESTATSPVG